MEPQQWETLQFHLTAGRVARDVGDRNQALEHIDAALAIDPDLAAAQELRDSVLAPSSHSETAEPAQAAPPASTIPPSSTDWPQINPEGYAQLEARVRRRRIDLCLDKARQAIAERRLPEAEAALDEVKELDSGAPELDELTADLAAVRPVSHDWDRMEEDRQADEPIAVDDRIAVDDPVAVDDRIADIALADRMAIGDHVFWQPGVSIDDRAAIGGSRGPWVVVAGLLVALAVFAVWTRPQRTESPRARRTESFAPPSTPAPAETAEAIASPPVPSPPVAATRPAPPPAALPSEAAPSVTPRTAARETDVVPPPATTVAPPPEAPQSVRQLRPRIADGPIPLTVIPERAAEPPVAANHDPTVDDAAIVRDTLQRYRRAYSNLDAPLAHAVFPILDERALAHAFANLRSQTLEYDSCSVDVRGESARAVCRGSLRYVPNTGDRTPRTERRVWTFTLEKANDDWKIAGARTDR